MNNIHHSLALFVKSALTLGIFIVCARFIEDLTSLTLIVGSFGALTVVLFSLNEESVARPKNVFFGHLLAAVIGVLCCFLIMPYSQEVAIVMAVSLSLAAMAMTNSTHPPAGAIAMIAVLAPEEVVGNGVAFVLGTALGGAGLYFAISWLAHRGVDYVLWFLTGQKGSGDVKLYRKP